MARLPARISDIAVFLLLVAISGLGLAVALRIVGSDPVPDRVDPPALDVGATPGRETEPHPNVVLIIADDLRRDKVTEAYLPNVWRLARDPDTVTFTNAFVSNPLCCPSRTTILTGRYSHTTGVWNNGGKYGGFRAFRSDADTIAVDFQQQGYRTAMIGKYLNRYRVERTAYVPPGWDLWFALNTGAYFKFPVRTNHEVLRFRSQTSGYSSTVLRMRAEAFVREGSAPFFLYLAFTAPHFPARPAPNDVGRFADEADWPRPRSDRRSMLAAAYAMDREIGLLLDALPPDTIVLFMSDNGVIWDERSTERGKRWPYDLAVHVPMLIAGVSHAEVPLRAGPSDIVSNVDLRVSLLHAVGLQPLSAHEGVDWFSPRYVPRDHILLEHGNPQFSYCGIRSLRALYIRFDDGREELYDERTDPGEVRNLVGQRAEELEALRRLAIEECRPAPPGFTWEAG